MKKLVCYYGGWFEVPVGSVILQDISGDEAILKTAEQFLNERGNIDELILESFVAAFIASTNGELGELDLHIEDDDAE
jgi:hypothetical protein